MYSGKAKKNADACRFCWMCRHLCPIQLVTGKETNTPRAKGLLVSLFERGLEMDAGAAETMYECLLCGACTDNCMTGFDPLVFIRESRTSATLDDLVPEWAQQVIDRTMETGNIYGLQETKLSLTNDPKQEEVLVWLGATARYAVPDVAEAFLSLLQKANVSFAVLSGEPSSGVALGDLVGHIEDVRKQAQAAGEAIRQTGAKKVVVLDSYDAAAFRHEYKEWGIELPEVETATSFVANLVRDGRLKPKQSTLTVTYHDASRLARDLDEHQPARDLIASMGLKVEEMFQNRRLAKCCGTGVMGQMQPKLSNKLCQGRWSDAERTVAKVMIAACPQSTEALRRCVPDGYTYQDLFVLLNEQT